MKPSRDTAAQVTQRAIHRVATVTICWLAAFATGTAQAPAPRPLAPLPQLQPAPDAKQVELGMRLFFDPRLSGDATISCAICHDPAKGWADGLALGKGYPGALYFRNTPTVLNAVHGRWLYHDGRLSASDLPTMVRDHITEAHFMQADGRLVIERMRQIPDYEQAFNDTYGGEPTYGRILGSVAAFVVSLRSGEVPFDAYLRGDKSAISAGAERGLELFRGKARCIQCHDGPMLSDDRFHDLGLATNRDIFKTPERHIVFRRFFKMLGVAEYATMRADPGRYAVTKLDADRGRFRTPTLRELEHTAPYMHNGTLATLGEVVNFYNQGGGSGAQKSSLLKTLDLKQSEITDLVEFLRTLSGKLVQHAADTPFPYKLRPLGRN